MKVLDRMDPSPERLARFHLEAGFALLQWLDFPRAFQHFSETHHSSFLTILALFPEFSEEFHLSEEELPYGNINMIVTNAKAAHARKMSPAAMALTERENLKECRWWYGEFLWASRVKAINDNTARPHPEIVDTVMLLDQVIKKHGSDPKKWLPVFYEEVKMLG